MKVRGGSLPSEDEIYWEASATRIAPDGKLEIKHLLLTHENAERLRTEFGDEWLKKYCRDGQTRVDLWADCCDEHVH